MWQESVGATQLGANVVGNGQLAPLSAPSELIGSNSASPMLRIFHWEVVSRLQITKLSKISNCKCPAWAPSFAFTGLNASTDVLMGSGWWPQEYW